MKENTTETSQMSPIQVTCCSIDLIVKAVEGAPSHTHPFLILLQWGRELGIFNGQRDPSFNTTKYLLQTRGSVIVFNIEFNIYSPNV